MPSIYSSHKPVVGEGGGQYLKIKDGETVRLRIASEPAIYETEGERDGQTKLTTRYGWIVWNQDTKQAQILQQSATFFKNLAVYAQDEDYGDPKDYDIKVTRQGSSFNDTTYTLLPGTKREPLSQEAKDAVKALDLLEKLKASPFSQRVMWLADYDKLSAGVKTSAELEASKVKPKADPVIEDIGDEPINLDDIPF